MELRDLYFVSPEGLKQRYINDFILGMCGAARWRFASKRELSDWARQERDMRWLMALTFMDNEAMTNESKYFQSQSIMCRLQKLKVDFKDISLMIGCDDPKVHPNKMDRVTSFAEEMRKLEKWAKDARDKLFKSVDNVLEKPGRREEEAFWRRLSKAAEKVCQEVFFVAGKSYNLEDKFRSTLGATCRTRCEKTSHQAKSHNKKKTRKRKATRAENAAMSGKVMRRRAAQDTLPIMRFLNRNPPRYTPWKCICYRYLDF